VLSYSLGWPVLSLFLQCFKIHDELKYECLDFKIWQMKPSLATVPFILLQRICSVFLLRKTLYRDEWYLQGAMFSNYQHGNSICEQEVDTVIMQGIRWDKKINSLLAIFHAIFSILAPNFRYCSFQYRLLLFFSFLGTSISFPLLPCLFLKK
jgi:hypothetical protein